VLSTGNFTDQRLETLRRKGEYLLMNGNQNTEMKRCEAISKKSYLTTVGSKLIIFIFFLENNKLKDSAVPMCNDPAQMALQVPWMVEGPAFRQNNPMPLSPRVLNLQKPKQLSPRKRASGSKENGGGAPPPKRFVYDEAAFQMACHGLHRM
jgi:hypothetical protein